MLRSLFAEKSVCNSGSISTLPHNQLMARSGDFLLYMDMLNVSHASPALQGHYEHLLCTIYKESQHV